MKAIRHSVFETNSSSTHSLSIENVYIDYLKVLIDLITIMVYH